MKIFNDPLLTDILRHNIEMTIKPDGIHICGFYKSGEVILNYDEENQEWIAHGRYNEETTIGSFDDLVELNYLWWNRSKNRASFWEKYDPIWDYAIQEWLSRQ